MSYSRFKMLQKFVNGIPTGEFTQGDLIQAGPFNTYDECNEGNASSEVTPDTPDMLYRWVASNEPWCEGTDEYKTEKQQKSADSGKSWVDTGATRRGEFVQSYSFTCGFVAERWIEVNPNVDFICENGNKFYLQKKEISNDGVNWTESGDKRKGPLIEANSADCSYPQYRWVEISIDTDYVCVGEDKYYKEKEQITQDGKVWQDTGNTRKGRVAEVHSTDCGYEPPTTVTRWIVVEDEFICQGVNKYQKEKEQISNDSGQTWSDTGNTRSGSLIEKNSYDCGYISYRWVDAPNEYVCQGTDKYQKQNEEKTSDGKVWTPTGRTRTGSLIEKNSYSCGYVSYRWVDVPNEYVCSGTDKYAKQKEQSSTDGSVWQDTGRERAGSLIERDSYSCGYISYRWVVDPVAYVCQGTDKYQKQNEEKTTDGQTWTPTGRTRTGSLIESESEDCGYVPPTPVKSDYLTFTALEDGRFKFTRNGLDYSTDGTTWKGLPANENTPTIAAGSKIYFKGKKTPSTSPIYGIGHFSSTGRFTASGTPMSLLFGDDFEGQTSLSGKDYAFIHLFDGCTKLISIDGLSLPATTLSPYSYGYMFNGCFRLTSIPSDLLPATALEPYCYSFMFFGCDGLTTIPSGLLPATTLAPYCYEYMLSSCDGFTTIPSNLLKATTLADNCYSSMFSFCRNLTTAPDLLADKLTDGCYQQIFEDCTNLNSIRMLATDVSATYCLSYWVSGVASSGTFYKSAGVTIETGVSGIPSGWTVVEAAPVQSDYLTFTALEDGTFKFTKAGLSYSTDRTNWTALAANANTPTITAGNKIYFKGTNSPSASNPYGIGKFSSTGNFTAKGTPMSLLFGDDFEGQTSLSGKRYAFSGLFSNCTKLKSIDGLLLPATTLEYYCYDNMFYGCTGLTSIPSGLLPSTTLEEGCYSWMFAYCSSLTSIPSGLLPSITLANYCYESMFNGCTGLTSIPSGLLPSTELAQYCYIKMFAYCSSLTEIPSDLLKATTLAYGCYSWMFQNCSSITTAPDLLATTLKTDCYKFIFYGCTNLNSIRMLATDVSATDCLLNWVSNVSPTGTFYKSAGVTLPTGMSGIPSGWTVVEV